MENDRSPFLRLPSTPSRPSHRLLKYKPLNSSPLVSPPSSPAADAQARRRSQYKSTTSSSDHHSSTNVPSSSSSPRRFYSDNNQKTFLRERFKAECLKHANKQRERAISGKRRHSDASSDDPHMDMNCEDEDEELVMQDELFRRIMLNQNRKKQYSYRISYAHEVGSSFDPDMEDVGCWEEELRAPSVIENIQITPQDLDEEELAAYAEEYATFADFADFAAVEDLLTLSDTEDYNPDPSSSQLTAKAELKPDCLDMDTS